MLPRSAIGKPRDNHWNKKSKNIEDLFDKKEDRQNLINPMEDWTAETMTCFCVVSLARALLVPNTLYCYIQVDCHGKCRTAQTSSASSAKACSTCYFAHSPCAEIRLKVQAAEESRMCTLWPQMPRVQSATATPPSAKGCSRRATSCASGHWHKS